MWEIILFFILSLVVIVSLFFLAREEVRDNIKDKVKETSLWKAYELGGDTTRRLYAGVVEDLAGRLSKLMEENDDLKIKVARLEHELELLKGKKKGKSPKKKTRRKKK